MCAELYLQIVISVEFRRIIYPAMEITTKHLVSL